MKNGTKKPLCRRLGLHKWHEYWLGDTSILKRRCLRCPKNQVFIEFDGPRHFSNIKEGTWE